MKNFPIGFWNYPSVDNTPITEVARWQNCGITLNQTPAFSYAYNDPAKLTALLDEMHRLHMQAIVFIRDLDFHNYVGNTEGYRAAFERALADFGHHPATYGFFVGDEPTSPTEFEACIHAYGVMRSLAPELTPLLNLHSCQIAANENICDEDSFEDWLDGFIDTIGCPLISYDCYSQMNPEEEGTHMYFLNLNIFNRVAHRKGVKLWTTLLSTGHFRYRVPSEDDLRWQLNTATASGCSGILWFLYYGNLTTNNYRGAPIDELGEESDTYRAMRRVQLIFHRRHGRILSRLTHKKTWHFHKAYGGYPLYESGEIPHLKSCESVHALPGIVSLFRDERGGQYIVIVNNSNKESGQFKLTFDTQLSRCDRYWDGHIINFLAYHHDAVLDVTPEGTVVGFYLAPGQMEIFRVETE